MMIASNANISRFGPIEDQNWGEYRSLRKNLGENNYQGRHEAITPPARPDSNPTNNAIVSNNSSQSSGNLEGTRLRSISLTRFCSLSKVSFFSALRPDSKSIIFPVGSFSKTSPKTGPASEPLLNLIK